MDKALFVSFASPDDKPVQAVCDILEREGIRCWIARRDVAPGSNWGRSIIEAIDDCPAMVLMLSTAANESIHVANEVERCVSKRKLLYVVRIQDVKPSPVLELHVSSRQWTDAWSAPIEPAIRALAVSLREKLGIAAPSAQSYASPPEALLSTESAGSATTKLAMLAARIASRTEQRVTRGPTDIHAVVSETLAQIDVRESGSMGSFYMDEGNLRHVYRSMRHKLEGVSDESARKALASHLDAEDPLTKWKAMKLLAMFGDMDASAVRHYWETQPRWIPRQLVFDLVKNVPIADRMLLLSDIAQFDENARIRERALQALVGFGATDYPEALVPAVQQGLRDDSDDVRRAAVSAAAEIDGEIAAEIALERLREDSAWGVRVAAAEVLGQNGGVDAIPELVHGLQRNGINEYVLANAVKAISKRLGTDPVVTKVKGVSDKSVREALLKAVAEQ